MSDNDSLYRYFSNADWLERFIEHGEVFFNSLSYFLACEDSARRDEAENKNIFGPADGLSITKLNGETFRLKGQLESRIRDPDRVFIYCLSGELTDHLYQKFRAAGCVAIYNVEEFKNRLQAKIETENAKFLASAVEYYDKTKEPGTRHAIPEQIIMSKPKDFDDEKEFRLAFVDDASILDVNNVQYSITLEPAPTVSSYANRVVEIGALSDICKIVRP